MLALDGGWEKVYREKTSAKRRNLHARRRRQLEGLGKLEVSVARLGSELEVALEEAFRLHRLRWYGRPDHSDFGTPDGMRFHRSAMRALLALDAPRIVTLRLDGRAIAFHYYFVLFGRMFVHRLGFDPAYARYSPGLINTLDAIAAAAREGARRVEFLGGGERYKLELADRVEPMHRLVGLPRGVRGQLGARAALAQTRAPAAPEALAGGQPRLLPRARAGAPPSVGDAELVPARVAVSRVAVVAPQRGERLDHGRFEAVPGA